MAIRKQLVVILLVTLWCLADRNSALSTEIESDVDSEQASGDQHFETSTTSSKLDRFNEIHDILFSETKAEESNVNLSPTKLEELVKEANKLNAALIQDGTETKKFHYRNHKFIELENYMSYLKSNSCKDADIGTIFPWRVTYMRYPSLNTGLNELAASYLLGCLQEYAKSTLERFNKVSIRSVTNLYKSIPMADDNAALYLLKKSNADEKITEGVITYLRNNYSSISQLNKLTMDQHKALFEKKMDLLIEKVCEPVTDTITPSLKTVFDFINEIGEIKRHLRLKEPIDPRVELVYMCYGAIKLHRSSTYGQFLASLINRDQIKHTLEAKREPLPPAFVHKLLDQVQMLQQVTGSPKTDFDALRSKKLGDIERENCYASGLKGMKLFVESIKGYPSMKDYIEDSVNKQLQVCIKEFDKKIGWIWKHFRNNWKMQRSNASKILDNIKQVLKSENSNAKFYDKFPAKVYEKALLLFVRSDPLFTQNLTYVTFQHKLRERLLNECDPFNGLVYFNLKEEFDLLRELDNEDQKLTKRITSSMGKAQVCEVFLNRNFQLTPLYEAFSRNTEIK